MKVLLTIGRAVTLQSAIASESLGLCRGQIVEAHMEDCAGTRRANYFVDLRTRKRSPKGYIQYPLVGVQIPHDAVVDMRALQGSERPPK